MTESERLRERQEWEKRVADFRASGLSIRKWCAKNGIKPHKLQYRLYPRKTSERNVSPEPTTWLQATLTDISSTKEEKAPVLTVKVGKIAIEVRPGFDEGLLSSIVRVLLVL